MGPCHFSAFPDLRVWQSPLKLIRKVRCNCFVKRVAIVFACKVCWNFLFRKVRCNCFAECVEIEIVLQSVCWNFCFSCVCACVCGWVGVCVRERWNRIRKQQQQQQECRRIIIVHTEEELLIIMAVAGRIGGKILHPTRVRFWV